MDTNQAEHPVGALLKQADQGSAILIDDFILMSEDISNSYLVMTPAGHVVINTGTVAGGALHKARYAAASPLPICKLVITQSHHDHFGGLAAFPDQAELITHRRFSEGYAYRAKLRPFYDIRAARIWKLILGDRQPEWPDFTISPDVLVEDCHAFELGGRRFEVLSVPGGETTDALAVWLPREKTVFTGNLLGPAYMTVPNLNPIRGDKPRSAMEYIRSVDRIRALNAELLITGHGHPIRGAETIARDLTHLRDAVAYLHDATVNGMVAGHSLEALMSSIKLPAALELHQWYGKVAWVVRTVWEEYTGWFQQDFTSGLYEVPVSRVFPDIVALAGATALCGKASSHLEQGKRLEALHLVEIVLTAEPGHHEATQLRLSILRSLLADAETIKNLNETMWLRSEISHG